MPFSIVRSSIASASAEAVFCPASARSELHRFILGPAGSAAGQKVRHLSGFPGSRSFITRLDHLRCLAACVAYPPSSAFPQCDREPLRRGDFRRVSDHRSFVYTQPAVDPLFRHVTLLLHTFLPWRVREIPDHRVWRIRGGHAARHAPLHTVLLHHRPA